MLVVGSRRVCLWDFYPHASRAYTERCKMQSMSSEGQISRRKHLADEKIGQIGSSRFLFGVSHPLLR